MASTSPFEIIFIGAIICLIIYCLFNNINNALPKIWPLVGMLPELLLQAHRINDWCTQILQQSPCTFLFKGPWFANKDCLLTVDPANLHYIMSSNFSNFPKGSEFNQMFDILGDGIFNADLDLWKHQRILAQTLVCNRKFYQFSIKTIHDKVSKCLMPILDGFCKQGLVVDLQDLLQRLTFDVNWLIATGYDPGYFSGEFPELPFAKAVGDAEEAIFYRHVVPESIWKLQRWLEIGEEKKLKKAWKIVDQVVGEIILAKKQHLRRKPEDGTDDLLASLMTEDFKSDNKFLRDFILTFMLAGSDTTSSALTWFFWLVSKNPQVEEKIREELKSIVPATTELFDIEKLKGLVYLHGALSESLRLYPPVPFQYRVPMEQDILPSGHHVKPKMKILISLYAMGRMTSIWGNDCLEFKPERWITELGRIKQEASYKFSTFGAGPRACLGKEVAINQMKAIAAAIIHNYNVQVVDGDDVVPSMSVIFSMKHGLKVKLTPRDRIYND